MDNREIETEADDGFVIERNALSDLSNLQDGSIVPVRPNASDPPVLEKAISHDVASAGA